uniref:Carboxypeptidase B-like n=1 Tax=Hirondellea gigas TaxID=1518452 RepID=A0A2P2HXG8_9CRUS
MSVVMMTASSSMTTLLLPLMLAAVMLIAPTSTHQTAVATAVTTAATTTPHASIHVATATAVTAATTPHDAVVAATPHDAVATTTLATPDADDAAAPHDAVATTTLATPDADSAADAAADAAAADAADAVDDTNGVLTPLRKEKRNVGDQIWSLSLDASTSKSSDMAALHENLDVLHYSSDSVTIFVRKTRLSITKEFLEGRHLAYNVVVNDVAVYLQSLQSAEDADAEASSRDDEICTEDNCMRPLRHTYMTFQQIEWFLKNLAERCPENVMMSTVGYSHNGNAIYLITVSPSADFVADLECGPRPAVFIDGGIHAREWIAPATVLNMLMKQTENCAANTDCDYEYYFMPMMNPDGYEYTWTNDRFWRKNRSPPPLKNDCFGTDLNRNWNPQWGNIGSSSNTCKEIYRGTTPFSEPETTSAKNVMTRIANNPELDLLVYLSYHSFGQLVLYPWGYTSDLAPTKADLEKGGNVYNNALKGVHNVPYVVQQAAELYPASGASDDFAYSLPIKYVYTVELRNTRSFLLPRNEIALTFEENYAGYMALLKHATSQSN